MSIIPLDLERTFERRWAARFALQPAGPQTHRPDIHRQPLAALAKPKRKTRRVEEAGLRPVTAA
jgi:hypothetical protein